MQSGHDTSAAARRRRAPRLGLATRVAVAAALVLASAGTARAAGEKDKEATALYNKAMDEDYLSVEFDKAEKKLRDALKLCGKDACSPKVVGKLHVGLGTVAGGAGKLDQARDEFVAALAADPQAQLIDALTTPELAKAFREAQKIASEKAPTGEPAKEPTEGPDEPAEAGGDIAHTPIPESEVSTPVPIYIELPDEIGEAKLTLRYKPFGLNKWKSLEMKPLGKGFAATVPCEDVTVAGDLKYYVVVQDDSGAPVATAGSLKKPHEIPIRNNLQGEPPSLPGQPPPQKCAVREDCPPGLPGCPAAAGTKIEGDACIEDVECASGLACSGGTCAPAGGASKGPRNLVGAWGQFDMLLMNGTENVCSPESGDSYVCFYPDDGGQFHGNPDPGGALPGTLQGGFTLASVRLLLSYDRHVVENVPLTVGARLGYAFGGSPEGTEPPPGARYSVRNAANSFLPIHAELRVAYHFGGVYEASKVKPFLFFGGGLAQVNGSVPLDICDRAQRNGTDIESGEGDRPCRVEGTNAGVPRSVDAYQITGLNFVGLGGGAIFGLTPTFGLAAELKVMFMLPTFGVVFAPTLGPVFAF